MASSRAVLPVARTAEVYETVYVYTVAAIGVSIALWSIGRLDRCADLGRRLQRARARFTYGRLKYRLLQLFGM
jgi:hypothetical protein